MRLLESIDGKIATVYHASGDVNCFKYILNHDWRDGAVGHVWGHGLYTCWTKDSAFHDVNLRGHRLMPKSFYMEKDSKSSNAKFDEYGNQICFRFEFLVDVTNFFFFDKETYPYYKKVHPESPATEDNFIEYQNQVFGTHFTSATEAHSVFNSSYVYDPAKTKIEGIIFVGGHDGDVAVIHNTELAIPTRFSKGDEYEWFSINDDKNYAEEAKLAALGILNRQDFWKKFEFSSAARDAMKGLYSADNLSFVMSHGTNLKYEDTLDEEIVYPDLDNQQPTTVYSLDVKDCLDVERINLDTTKPLHNLNIHIENTADGALKEIQLGGKTTTDLKITDCGPDFTINRCPDLHLNSIDCTFDNTKDTNFKLRLMSVNNIKTDAKIVKLINVRDVNTVELTDCGEVLIKNMTVKSLILKGVKKLVLKNATILHNAIDNEDEIEIEQDSESVL